jgi:thiol peroxidase
MNYLTLLGPALKSGDQASNFIGEDNNLSSLEILTFVGKICLIASVPSLDTPVCDLETRRFNGEAGKFSSGIQILL